MFEIDKKRLASFVSKLRKEKGWTQKELAEKLFISDKAVSKWETAVSIPDTALLIPLSELLGVTVTELLMCERMEHNTSMDTGQVEDVVKTALAYSEKKTARAYQVKSIWPVVYLISVLTGGTGTLICYRQGMLDETLLTSVILGVVFGAYFCFFVKTRLPVYYDENRCGLYCDGAFRMNMLGVTFNNSNWPYIVRTGRIWSCLSVALYPVMSLAVSLIHNELWTQIGRYVFLVLLLGGLFIPIYIVARKYQ